MRLPLVPAGMALRTLGEFLFSRRGRSLARNSNVVAKRLVLRYEHSGRRRSGRYAHRVARKRGIRLFDLRTIEDSLPGKLNWPNPLGLTPRECAYPACWQGRISGS